VHASFFASSVHVLLKLFPEAILGVMIFMSGAELALASRP
jgi:hypothetical protein